MSMWEPRSSHLYVGRGGACPSVAPVLSVRPRGRGARCFPPPSSEGQERGVRVCASIQCAPLHPCVCACVRAFVDLCVQPWSRACLTSCVWVRAAPRGRAAYAPLCARGCFRVPRCVGKGASVFSRGVARGFTALRRFPGRAWSSLEHRPAGAQDSSFPPSGRNRSSPSLHVGFYLGDRLP